MTLPCFDEQGYTDYGYMNGWKTIPPAVEECIIKRRNWMAHKVRTENYGKCVTVFTCDHCKLRYRVDSGD